MAMDLSKHSIKDLQALKKDIDREIGSRRKQEEKKAREELKKVAESYGFTLNELVSGAPAKAKSRTKAPARFVHPNDSTKTWTGRGRKPAWVKEWEAAGRTVDQLKAL